MLDDFVDFSIQLMADAPSFSSFPDIFGDQPEAGPSGTNRKNHVPSFSSFPEVEESGRLSSKRRKDDGDRDGRMVVVRREEGEERRARKKLERREHQASDERERERDRHRDRRKRQDSDREVEKRHRHSRRRSRSRERDRTKRNEDERELEKEERRSRERERAAALARADAGAEDDVPWYESKSSITQSAPIVRLAMTMLTVQNPASSYFVDTVGDRDVMLYHAITSFKTPRFRRDKGGRVLGLPEGLRIVYNSDRAGKGIEVGLMGRPYVRAVKCTH